MFFKYLLFILFLFSQSLLAQAEDLNLPDLGDRVSGVISLEQEKTLGAKFLRASLCSSSTDK